MIRKEFDIVGDDFANAGHVSTQIKAILTDSGQRSDIIRRMAIASYEAEMNVVMYADFAHLTLEINRDKAHIVVDDRGPGITDVDLALKEGYSTATDKMREKGFGAGMGLPNIRRNADIFEISSTVNEGTRVDITVLFDHEDQGEVQT